MLPPCDVDPELAEPRPLELPLSSELLEPELLDPELLEPKLLELELLEFESSSELLELAVVPVVPESECRADTTATDKPVPPIPRTAVAIAAADARRNQGRRGA